MPEPPVIDVILARRKLARTPVTLRASPAVTVEVSMVEYWASASIMADCSVTLIAEGAGAEDGLPADGAAIFREAGVAGEGELLAGLSCGGRFGIEGERDVAGENRVGRILRVVVRHGGSRRKWLVTSG